MSTNIPLARQILSFVAMAHPDTAADINLALSIMTREISSRGPVKARRMTPEIKSQIRQLRARFPHALQREIGDAVGVDGGRVCETLAEARDKS